MFIIYIVRFIRITMRRHIDENNTCKIWHHAGSSWIAADDFSSTERYTILSIIKHNTVFKTESACTQICMRLIIPTKLRKWTPKADYLIMVGSGGLMKTATNPAKIIETPAARMKLPFHAACTPPTSPGKREITLYAFLPSPRTLLLQ